MPETRAASGHSGRGGGGGGIKRCATVLGCRGGGRGQLGRLRLGVQLRSCSWVVRLASLPHAPCRSACLCVCVSVCMSFCLSVCVSVCLYVCHPLWSYANADDEDLGVAVSDWSDGVTVCRVSAFDDVTASAVDVTACHLVVVLAWTALYI